MDKDHRGSKFLVNTKIMNITFHLFIISFHIRDIEIESIVS